MIYLRVFADLKIKKQLNKLVFIIRKPTHYVKKCTCFMLARTPYSMLLLIDSSRPPPIGLWGQFAKLLICWTCDCTIIQLKLDAWSRKLFLPFLIQNKNRRPPSVRSNNFAWWALPLLVHHLIISSSFRTFIYQIIVHHIHCLLVNSRRANFVNIEGDIWPRQWSLLFVAPINRLSVCRICF